MVTPGMQIRFQLFMPGQENIPYRDLSWQARPRTQTLPKIGRLTVASVISSEGRRAMDQRFLMTADRPPYLHLDSRIRIGWRDAQPTTSGVVL